MNKLELINSLSDTAELTRHQAKSVVNLFFNAMAEALARGDRVDIRGFCSFCVKGYDGYVGHNPSNRKMVKVAPKKLPFFKSGKDLKERVDQNYQ